MSTTLPLFWHLSSASQEERIDASVKLVSALEHFQTQFAPKVAKQAEESEGSEEDEGEDEDEDSEEQTAGKGTGQKESDRLDEMNAQDVSYSIRRLTRGLASPVESSRLGFAVALTELLSRINTVTCSQILALVVDSSKIQGSMTGQEERDMLFARLFGITSIIQSGLLVRQEPLPSSSTPASTLEGYTGALAELVALGEKKSWLKEVAWWTIDLAIDALHSSTVSWKDDAWQETKETLYLQNKTWTPEKVGVTLKLQEYQPDWDWKALLQPPFKNADVLSIPNFATLGKVLKESYEIDDDDSVHKVNNPGSWKPQVHWVWDAIFAELLPASGSAKSSFPEFFRIVVDEALFSAASSPERKLWGFQIFQKALPRVDADNVPFLFTKNFMRCWINHLSKQDRYLHKAARQVATDIHTVARSNPKIGFALILQLTGVHGNKQFDKLTRTKTVESILTSMDAEGIDNYITNLLEQFNASTAGEESDFQALNGRRSWVIDQLAALIRNGAIPKTDSWVVRILNWLIVHGLFVLKKNSEKSPIDALHTVPKPVLSDELRKSCRERLLSCLGDLANRTIAVSGVKRTGVASDGELWVSKVVAMVNALKQDTKHAKSLKDVDEADNAVFEKALTIAAKLRDVGGDDGSASSAQGAQLLIEALYLRDLCSEENEEVDTDPLEACADAAQRMFLTSSKKAKKKKSRKSSGGDEPDVVPDVPEPIDILVDAIIGLLENSSSFMRTIANQSFALLSDAATDSTIDLILAQLERRDPNAEEDEDEELDEEADDVEQGDDDDDDDDDDEGSESSENDKAEEDEESMDEEPDLELRSKIEEALRVNGVDRATRDADEESEEEAMDDEQMMAIDNQLAEIFRSRAESKKKEAGAQREATHFKNRVLDLLDIFIKTQSASPLIVRIIVPLVVLVVGTGQDEKQLSDKTQALLKSRVGKLKEIPEAVDADHVIEVLKDVHLRARKARSSDVLATISQCSLYLSRILLRHGRQDAVVEVYQDSLSDFATRKASPLNSNFFLDAMRRHKDLAWALRGAVLKLQANATNAYRRCQIFLLLQPVINQLPVRRMLKRFLALADIQLQDDKEEAGAFLKKFAEALHGALIEACDEATTLSAPQMKELLKLALAAVRHTKNSASTDVALAWSSDSWTTLHSRLIATERFKASKALHSLSKQIVQVIGESSGDSKSIASTKPSATKAAKRKGAEGVDDPGKEITKRKKSRKD
ncbi:hypothetical protein PUNSTDRAFT_70289 [Punctularia strigosozonata HHB-11173 SS5]|uniref:uncharacterized protein n=1 Tax=Punctularia strigosozonata (strain HHB-11173) TaxID=741275 RepID=UPI0004418087|nr:uncharacterized protein PUNSTDRAFT_70289 [Punctularia strigosozonata HHB-11173 SS5]EIN07831.1 hypothetical protein PUNSTDRAFT_70289 [Punctularia strigosozonata HHB-11173 SS5]